jgi:hypothetical protein
MDLKGFSVLKAANLFFLMVRRQPSTLNNMTDI